MQTKRPYRYWTAKEVAYLRKNAGKLSHREMAVALGRSIGSVNKMCEKFGLPFKGRGRGEPMQDCFAYKNKRCTILKQKKKTAKQCKCEGCNFYKTKEQYQLDKQKAIERILSLDANRRDYIIETYYGGRLEVEGLRKQDGLEKS